MDYFLPKEIENLIADGKTNFKEKIVAIATEIVKDDVSSHDISHLTRVYELARTIADHSRFTINDQQLLPACFFHDVGYNLEINNDAFVIKQNKSLEHEKRGALFSADVLTKMRTPQTTIDLVVEAIRLHDNFRGSVNFEPTDDLLALTLQDADRLDAIGIIGLTRWFMYAKANNIPNFDATVPLENQKYGERNNTSVIHNLHSNAINLYKDLNLEAAKEIGKQKSTTIKDFIKEYLEELNQPRTEPYLGAIALANIFRESKDLMQIKATISNKIKEHAEISPFVATIISSL